MRSVSSWLIIVLVLICMLVRLAVAARDSLWRDEIFSIAVSAGHLIDNPTPDRRFGDFPAQFQVVDNSTLREFTQLRSASNDLDLIFRCLLTTDVHPPLYFLGLRFWQVAFGSTDFVLRTFSILWSTLTVPFLWSLAYAIGGKRIAAISTILYSLSPWSILYGTEVRPYGLGIFLVVVYAWLITDMNRRGYGHVRYWASILVASCGFLTHYFFIFPWIATVLFQLTDTEKLSRKQTLIATALSGVLIVPWLINLINFVGRHGTETWYGSLSGIGALKSPVVNYFSYYYVSHKGLRVFLDIVVTLVTVRILLPIRTVPKNLIELSSFNTLACTVGPLVVSVVKNLAVANVRRYACFGVCFAYIFFARCLLLFPSKIRWCALILIVLCFGFDDFLAVTGPDRHSIRGFRVTAQHLKSQDKYHFVVVIGEPAFILGMSRYLPAKTRVLPINPSFGQDFEKIANQVERNNSVSCVVELEEKAQYNYGLLRGTLSKQFIEDYTAERNYETRLLSLESQEASYLLVRFFQKKPKLPDNN